MEPQAPAAAPPVVDAPAPKSAPKAPGAGRTELPPGVRTGKLRRRALELIDKLPEADRQRIDAALRKLPPAEAGRILTELGRLNDAAALRDALAERLAPPPEAAEGPAQPSSGLDDSAEAHVGEDENLRQVENRPPPRVSDTQPGVSRAALKARMQAPAWATGPGDWNPHHLIPVSLETHPVLETLRANGGWDNNAARNGYALPTRPGIPGAEKLPVHQVTPEVVRNAGRPRPSPQTMRDLQGHPVWNTKVKLRLDALESLMDHPAELRTKVEALIDELRNEIDTSIADGKPVLF
jgi:hypothetical protein